MATASFSFLSALTLYTPENEVIRGVCLPPGSPKADIAPPRGAANEVSVGVFMSADAFLLLALFGSALTLLSMQPWAFVVFGVLFCALCLRMAWQVWRWMA